MKEEKWISIDRASPLLGRSIRTVRRYCEKGTLRAQRPGKTWQIDPISVEKLLENRAPPTADADSDVAVAEGTDKEVADNDSGGDIEPDTDKRTDSRSTSSDTAEDTAKSTDEQPSSSDTAEDIPAVGGCEDDRITDSDDRTKKVLDRISKQVQEQRTRVDQLEKQYARLAALADRTKNLESAYRRLRNTLTNMKVFMGLLVVIPVIVTGLFFAHHSRYYHVPGSMHTIQQMKEQAEEELVMQRLAALEQSVNGSKDEGTSTSIRPILRVLRGQPAKADSGQHTARALERLRARVEGQ